jgi:hypothetical protein
MEIRPVRRDEACGSRGFVRLVRRRVHRCWGGSNQAEQDCSRVATSWPDLTGPRWSRPGGRFQRQQVPASTADHDVATPCQAILAGSGYNTIPADRRPTWALAVMNRDPTEARLGGRDDGPDGEPGGRAACPARHLRMRRRSSAGAPTTADEALQRHGGPWFPRGPGPVKGTRCRQPSSIAGGFAGGVPRGGADRPRHRAPGA